MRRDSRGFTLIELLVVVTIIALLALFVVPQFVGQGEKAKVKATIGLISQLDGQIESFKLEHNRYPDKLEDLVNRPSYIDQKDWPQGGYLKKMDALKDAWGERFIYRIPGSGEAAYDLISLGADRKEGGENVNTDLWNHDKGTR